ncbi:MAG: hypothetical protein ACN6O7_17210 [Sphingobacterium sp.]
MGYYENIKCGNCRYSFTNGYASSNGFLKTHLGPPYLKCPNCSVVNKTKYAPYSTFHPIAKGYFWFSQLVRYILFLGLIAFALIGKFTGANTATSAVIATVLASFCAVYFGLKEIKSVEDEYNNLT